MSIIFSQRFVELPKIKIILGKSTMFYRERELPPQELREHKTWSTFRNFGVQWSQLVAWSWLKDSSLYKDKFSVSYQKSRLKKALVTEALNKESELKKKFIQQLLIQARSTDLYATCDAEVSVLDDAVDASETIKSMLLGEQHDGISLSDVLECLTGQGLMTTVDQEVKSMFKEFFTVRVVIDTFAGKITEGGEDTPTPYIIELSYPPCPALGHATMTEDALCQWATTPNPKFTDYIEPGPVYPPWTPC